MLSTLAVSAFAGAMLFNPASSAELLSPVCVEKYRDRAPKCIDEVCYENVSIDYMKMRCRAESFCDGFSFTAGSKTAATYGNGCLKSACCSEQQTSFEMNSSYYDCRNDLLDNSAQVFEGMTKIATQVCTGTRNQVCPPRGEGGRCGPLFGHTSCAHPGNFCNEDNGWCGTTDAHRDLQSSTKYDYCASAEDAVFTVPYDIKVSQVKIVHKAGHVNCVNHDRSCGGSTEKYGTAGADNSSKFGCECTDNIGIMVTDSNNKRVVPGKEVPVVDWFNRPVSGTESAWYRLPGFHAHSDEIVMDGDKIFKAGEEYRIWYGEDLMDETEHDNQGNACYDIYAHVDLTCPSGTSQVGTLDKRNDVDGCGLAGCNSWYRLYKYGDVFQCAAACKKAAGCTSFSYAPIGGEKNWASHKVCTHYGEDITYAKKLNAGPKQIMCVVDVPDVHRRLESLENAELEA